MTQKLQLIDTIFCDSCTYMIANTISSQKRLNDDTAKDGSLVKCTECF